jgi:hypothetical protein
MTFELEPLHPSMPRRPARTSVRESKRFSSRPLKKGGTQVVDLTQDRLRVLHFGPSGKFEHGYFFEREDAEVLEAALRIAEGDSDRPRNIGRAPFKDGGYIEVGARTGVLLFRRRRSDDSIRSTMVLSGDEIIAFKQALHEFAEKA